MKIWHLTLLSLFSLGESFILKAPAFETRRDLASSGKDDAIPQLYPEDPLEEWSEERKANLFQFLLRDLQVEGVPLLGVDADQVATMQAAIWTTMAELSEQALEQQACLIFEDIPIATLMQFVNDFESMKQEQRLVQEIPELSRYSLSVLGKGVGPAILLKTENKTDLVAISEVCDSIRCNAAMRMFMDRRNSEYVPEQDVPEPTEYRVSDFAEVCHILSLFWNSICELGATSNSELGAIIQMIPSLKSHARFAAISQVVSRSLALFQEDAKYSVAHFHPDYDRGQIQPKDDSALGHLPPKSWFNSMILQSGKFFVPCDEDLELINFQRRAPVPAFCVSRVDAGASVPTELDLGDRKVTAYNIERHAASAIKMVEIGEERLKQNLQKDLEVFN